MAVKHASKASGYLTRERVRKVQLLLVGYLAYCIVSAMMIWTALPKERFATPLWIAVAAGPVVLYGMRGSIRDLVRPLIAEYSGRAGATRALAPLTTGPYHVMHDVDLGRGTVDCVVVGPSGIYAIEFSAWPGRFESRRGRLTRSGISAETVRTKALDASGLAYQRLAVCGLDYPVVPVLALTRSRLADGPISHRRVHLVEAQVLAAWISSRPVKLETTDVERARAALEPYIGN